jgi:hypothetical protein
MPTRKQAAKRAPVRQGNRLMREARRLNRATRRERATPGKQDSGGKQDSDDIFADHDFHARPEDISAEEIEIDPLLDQSKTTEP